MRRRLAATAAVTSAFVLFAAAPAFAQSEPEPFEGNVTCEELEAVELIEGLIESIKIDPAADEVNEFFTADLHGTGTGTLLDVTAEEGFMILAVIVKGGPDSNVYFDEPFIDMHAPELEQSGNIPEISHYEVCIGEEVTPTPTPTPTPTETPSESPTVQPTASESPAVVPTAVPAGADNGGGNGSAGLMGLALAGGVAVAGAAAAVRRRTRHGA